MTICVICCQPGKLIRDLVPRVFIGCWWHAHSACLCQAGHNILRLSEGNQVFSINHIICTNILGTVSHSCPLMVGTLPKPQFLEASQRPTLQAELSEDSTLGLLCSLFSAWWSFRHFPSKGFCLASKSRTSGSSFVVFGMNVTTLQTSLPFQTRKDRENYRERISRRIFKNPSNGTK